MPTIEQLERELKELREKKDKENKVKQLKKQIKAERFAQTKGGKIFNKVANIGDAGAKWLMKGKTQQGASKRKIQATPTKPISVEEMLRRLPQ